jgi:flagellar biosynthesis/type III secretory pathway protein FliH
MARKDKANGETLPVVGTTEQELRPDKPDVSDARSVPSGTERIHDAAEQAPLEGEKAEHGGSVDDTGTGRKPRTAAVVRKVQEPAGEKIEAALSPGATGYLRKRQKGEPIPVRVEISDNYRNGYEAGYDDGYDHAKRLWHQIVKKYKLRLEEAENAPPLGFIPKMSLFSAGFLFGVIIAFVVGR